MLRRDFCKNQAHILLEQFKIVMPPVNVEEIATRCGLTIDYIDLPDKFSGRLRQERRIIQVNKNHHPHRQRWTMAHELGHYILQHDVVFFTGDSEELGAPSKLNDLEADTFAAALIMPEEWIKKDWLEIKNLDKMSQRYWVSKEAMTRRLLNLRIL